MAVRFVGGKFIISSRNRREQKPRESVEKSPIEVLVFRSLFSITNWNELYSFKISPQGTTAGEAPVLTRRVTPECFASQSTSIGQKCCQGVVEDPFCTG